MTTTIAIESPLERNLQHMGERNADFAKKIRQAEPYTDISIIDTQQSAPAVIIEGKGLCSKHRPIDEAERLTESIDLVENAVVVVLGFGAGYHVKLLAERMHRTGIIIVFESDLKLLRAVFENIDHSQWINNSLVVWVTDPSDSGELARLLDGSESIIAQGVHFLEHPNSRSRLAKQSAVFVETFSKHVSAAKTTLLTTLMRSIDTIRNNLLNFDHYAAGAGIDDIENIAKGYPAVVVSAGPSLRKNVHLLAQPGVRDRCVIIAAQTTLRPLLDLGIKPHFVTALDYHQISKRFYEGITQKMVQGVTLVAEPKAHPAILDSFPGAIRCCGAGFLDQLLGEHKRPMGNIPAGATVAHLALYLARHLGCNPISFIGQDLGFTDGLYYTPGTAIHEVWAPELNPFNTIEMMEWQRIVRHRSHLQKMLDVHGRSIYSDLQMSTYLNQFERDFANYQDEDIKIIDATEGGVAKQRVENRTLAEVLEKYATKLLPEIPVPATELDSKRLSIADDRVNEVLREITQLKQTSKKTASIIRKMLRDQLDHQKMEHHFKKIEKYRKDVKERFSTFEILSHLNQLGVFNRFKADRRLQMQEDLDPIERQKAQLDRDLQNVIWIADAADEMSSQLKQSSLILQGKQIDTSNNAPTNLVNIDGKHKTKRASKIAALVPIDPFQNSLGVKRSLAEQFSGQTVLQTTLQRLGTSQQLKEIILISPHDFDVEALIDRSKIGLPVEIEHCDGSPFGNEFPAVAAARKWSPTSWRGGIGGMSIYDEVLCPQIMSQVMKKRELTAAIIVGPDWPLVDVSSEAGCDAVIERHLQMPDQHGLVFTQAPPGLCVCLLSAGLMQELSIRNRVSTVGGLLVYQPNAPQPDTIARDANIQIDHDITRSRIRATFDAPRYKRAIKQIIEPKLSLGKVTSAQIVEAITEYDSSQTTHLPQHVILELNCQRKSKSNTPWRSPISIDMTKRIFQTLGEEGDCVLTLHGTGDPLLHDQFDEIIKLAKSSGISGIHLRTELLTDQTTLDRLLKCQLDVVSIDLNADRAETYKQMMGVDGFREVLENMQYLLANRKRLTDHSPNAAFAIPWIVPRIKRCCTTYQDIESFFDRWQMTLGAAVIEPCTKEDLLKDGQDILTETAPPSRVMIDVGRCRMMILCDGSVPVSEFDAQGLDCVGNVKDSSVSNLWKKLVAKRNELASQLKYDELPDWVVLP